jgi:hypothetical protein
VREARRNLSESQGGRPDYNSGMNSELKQKIEKYVTDKYAVEQQKIRADFKDKMKALPQQGKGNGAYSVYIDDRHIKLYVEMVNALSLATGEITIKAYEIFGAELDGEIIREVKSRRDCLVSVTSGSVRHELELEKMRGVRRPQGAETIANYFKTHLTVGTQNVDREFGCLLEERKAMPRQTNNYVGSINMNAPGQKVVFGDESSHNTTNERSFFLQVGEIVRTQVPTEAQSEILQRLSALERALYKPDFAEHWRDFRAAASDYWTLLAPCLPTIQDYLHKHGII